MSTIELVDPELRDALAQWPLVPLTAETLTRRRADALELIGAVPKPNLPDIETDEIHVESAFGAKPIRVLTYRPVRSDGALPVIVHIHGGGFVMGTPEMKDVENRLFASELKCAIYSVDHRLAPEAPHPAPVEDIYSVFAWLHANAGQLGLDPARIGIKGESGGGGFAAAAALYARDRQGPKFAFQHLIYPMIDDRTAVRKDLHPYVGEFVWTQENNYFGWRSLLGEKPGSAGVSPYAAAARAADVLGLPPTYISVGGLDLFLEENMIYADRLSRAGRASHVSAGVSRLLSGNECPRDQAGRPRHPRGAATFPARIGHRQRVLTSRLKILFQQPALFILDKEYFPHEPQCGRREPRRRHARTCPRRCAGGCVPGQSARQYEGPRPYGLRCLHWDPRRNAHGVCQMLYRHGWSVTL
jgi:acetyl esterase/lipase